MRLEGAVLFVKILVLGFLAAYGWEMGTYPGELNAFGKFVSAQFFFSAAALYLLPTWEAWERKHHNMTGVVLVNLLLGWTLVGWVTALVWACWNNPKQPVAASAPAVSLDSSDGAGPAPQSGESRASGPAVKICPFCAEEVLAAAIRCKHCGSDIPA